MKKSWKKPELTVLVRTRTEEMILGGCKNALTSGDPHTAYGNCQRDSGIGSCAGPCSVDTNS